MNINGIVISLLITGAILLLQHRRKRRFMARFRVEAEAAFARLLTLPAGGGEIVSEKEEVEQSGGALLAYVLTRIVRLPAGDYRFFMFRSDSPPYCKALDEATASALLGPARIGKAP